MCKTSICKFYFYSLHLHVCARSALGHTGAAAGATVHACPLHGACRKGRAPGRQLQGARAATDVGAAVNVNILHLNQLYRY